MSTTTLQIPSSSDNFPPTIPMEGNPMAEFLTKWLSPTATAIIVTTLIAFLIPLLQHLYLYRKASASNLPEFLLAGPSGSGKTSILTLFETGKSAPTHTSQAPLTVETDLPVSATARSDQYRSVNDPTNKQHKKLLLVDTPGHGKLRHYALNDVVNPKNLRGVIFVVDSSALSQGEGLTETAQYLHDLLLALQKRHTKAKTSKIAGETPVLIAANKGDLFTSLPAGMVKKSLEAEVERLRQTKSRGLIDSGVGLDDGMSEDQDPLGGGGEGMFEFELMREYGVEIDVVGGSVIGASTVNGADVQAYWDWIARYL